MLEGLDAAIETLNAIDLDTLSDQDLDDLVVGLQDSCSRLAAAQARLVARWDARMVWADDGSKAAGARLARDSESCKRTAYGLLRRARRLTSMPIVADAFCSGALHADVVDLLVRVNLPRRRALFARDEEMLVRRCRAQEDEPAVRQVLAKWAQLADEHLGYNPLERERDGRCFRAVRTLGGTIDLTGTLDRVEGTIVLDEHARIEHELFQADWAVARNTYGKDCGADKLARTATQRRADALVEMARRSAACPTGARRTRPLVSVLVGYETFKGHLCELADGTPLTRDHLLPLLAEADIERIVFDSPSQVIDVGRRERFFTGALRHAIEIRDRHCQHDGCDVPAEYCQIDHKTPYTRGGETTEANGRAHCGTHNRRRNRTLAPYDPENLDRIIKTRARELVDASPPP
jgi:5-methylcytosine-specific restriction endonuclease McrA